ncbi:hypothetical protein QN372_00335 [Undibacterium sp. RTI2.1]|uniref:hypothetical protein n=1 Tax=unclassified Undibacterium TaxID=2630295 RepID=UPI002AB56A1B|nr:MULTISPECIES: hypothetical protein [unclassified Undibacterium]MDY7537585.1 hypothetical protein [Undibacterium sp. 5I1]MEB0029186.1 hypothetical protein [Undibacterium sp. RTI2.1]MEB0115493.1 hypothetical protein [Undibacterium sp. RTI2.2]MEB0231970.1 hypothetical protein [Undibacterium sp. 10I3]MEB0256321.1 hypothetical protein [Undibacterium sp. 5I1]
MTKPLIVASNAIAAPTWTHQDLYLASSRAEAELVGTDHLQEQENDYLDEMQEMADVSHTRSRGRYLRSAKLNHMH